MDLVDYECQLLYKQDLKTWFEDNDRTKKFPEENLEFVKMVQQKYKFKYDENEEYDYREKFYLNGRFGHLFFSEPDQVLFSFTELDGTITMYERSIESDSSDSANPVDYQKIYLQNVIKGSNYGGKILAYSSEGHIFMIDLDTRIGKLVAIWPVDPKIAQGGCYGLIEYNPHINASVNGDFSLVAATGPSEEEEAIQIRIFNLNTKECSVKTPKLSAGYRDSNSVIEIYMLAFNPYHSDLLYLSLCVRKSQYHSSKQGTDGNSSDDDDDDEGDDGNDDDDDDVDNNEHLALVLFEVSTGNVLADLFDVSLIPSHFFYDTVESVTFLKQGSLLVTYKELPSSGKNILFLDAFSLEIIGSVNITGNDAVLGSDLLLSSCNSQFAIFKCQNLSSSNELKYHVEVYKVPDNDFSLKNFCRKVILDKVDINYVENLNLPRVLKKYLKL